MVKSKNRSIGVLGGFKDYLSPIGNVTINLFHNKMKRFAFNFTRINATFYPFGDYPEGVAMYAILVAIILVTLLLILLAYFLVVVLSKPRCPKLVCCLKYFAITTVAVCTISYIIEVLGWVILHEDLLYLKKKYIAPALAYFDKITGLIPLVHTYLEWLTTMTTTMYLAGQATGMDVEKTIKKALKDLNLLQNSILYLQTAANAIWTFQLILMIVGFVILAWSILFFSLLLIWPIVQRWDRFLCGVVIGAVVTWFFWAVFFLAVFPITMALSDFCFEMKIITKGYNGTIKDYMDYFLECKGDNPLDFISGTLSAITTITGAVTSAVMPGLSAIAGFVTGGAITGESVVKMQDDMSLLSDYTSVLSLLNCTYTSAAYRDVTKYVCSNILVGLSMCLFSTLIVLLFLYAYLLTGIRIKGFLTYSCWREKDENPGPPPPPPPSNPKKKPEKPKKRKKEKKEQKSGKEEKPEKEEIPKKKQKEIVPQAAKRPPKVVQELYSGEPMPPCGNICTPRGYAAEGEVAYPKPTYKDNTKRFHKDFTCSLDVTPWIR